MPHHLARQPLHPADLRTNRCPAVDRDQAGPRWAVRHQARRRADRKSRPEPINPSPTEMKAQTLSPVRGRVCPDPEVATG